MVRNTCCPTILSTHCPIFLVAARDQTIAAPSEALDRGIISVKVREESSVLLSTTSVSTSPQFVLQDVYVFNVEIFMHILSIHSLILGISTTLV